MSSVSNVTIRPTKPAQVEPFEGSDVVNEVFDSEVVKETSPSFHGFPSANSEVEKSGTPKRVRGRDGSGDRLGKMKKLDLHPKLGSKIWMQTIQGKSEYTVESKKNNKPGDFSYVLVSFENRKASFDLKEVPWDYLDENVIQNVDDPLDQFFFDSWQGVIILQSWIIY